MLGLGLVKKNRKNKKPTTPYQQWQGYPESPLLTADFPYQVIAGSPSKILYLSKSKIYDTNSHKSIASSVQDNTSRYCTYDGTSWSLKSDTRNAFYHGGTYSEADTNVYADSSLTSVYFAKTTP